MSRPRKTKADVRRAALLKCRYAGRYDRLGEKWSPAPEDEAFQEQWASGVSIPLTIFADLVREGLLTTKFRLTAAGHAALAELR